MSGAALPRFGRAKIQPLVSGNYRPSDAGQWAIILGVQDRFEELVDCVAWLPSDAGRWWLRHGDETPILGAAALAQAAWYREPVKLYSTPEAWLFAQSRQGSGWMACVLDWGVDLAPLFDDVLRVNCDSPELQNRLWRTFRSREPRITAPGRRGRRAA